MEGENSKRHRSSNFDHTEIKVLIDIILERKDIIENKKTDGVTIQDKRNGWLEVQTRFAAMTGQNRSVEGLKHKYENVKRTLKKKITENKRAILCTGGGPHKVFKLEDYEEQLLGLLQTSIEGLASRNDCDKVILSHDQEAVATNKVTPSTATVTTYVVTEDGSLTNTNDIEETTSNLATREEREQSAPFVNRVIKQKATGSVKRISNWHLKGKGKNKITSKETANESLIQLNEEKLELVRTYSNIAKEDLKRKADEAEFLQEEKRLKIEILESELRFRRQMENEYEKECERKALLSTLETEEYNIKLNKLRAELKTALRET